MTWIGSIDIGDHVRTARETPGGFLAPPIPRGRVGIVREVSGLLTRVATVEFLHGGDARVPIHHLKRTHLQGAEEGWVKRKQRRRGYQLGMLVLNLPLLVALARYLLDGGTLAGLTPAIAGALAGIALTVLGHPRLLALALIVLLVLRVRRRTDSRAR